MAHLHVPNRFEISLTTEEISLIVEALDSHEYWQLSEPSWRSSGAVFLPGEDDPCRPKDL